MPTARDLTHVGLRLFLNPMGQQQLLLLVVGVVVVGLAVAVGIQAFRENEVKSRMDRQTEMAVQIATEITAWWMKPAAMGGGGRTVSPARVRMEQLGYPQNEDGAQRTGYWDYANDLFRGIYVPGGPNTTTAPLVHIHPVVWNAERAVMVELAVHGPRPECFARRTGITVDGTRRYEGSIANPDPALCHW